MEPSGILPYMEPPSLYINHRTKWAICSIDMLTPDIQMAFFTRMLYNQHHQQRFRSMVHVMAEKGDLSGIGLKEIYRKIGGFYLQR